MRCISANRHTKALALLAYLPLTRQLQDRDALIALPWPEFDAASARNNLRRELSRLKITLGTELLVANQLQVRWNGQGDTWLDVAAFQARSSSGNSMATLPTRCAPSAPLR